MGDEFVGEDSTADRRFTEEVAVVASRKDKWYSWDLTKAVQYWASEGAASGIYWCYFKAGDFVATRKMVLEK